MTVTPDERMIVPIMIAARELAGFVFLMTLLCMALAPSSADAATRKTRPPAPTKPLICAHRGASAVAPENTMAAFRAAKRLGADSFELDTYLTADGVAVLLHDGTVDRTTDGTGPIGKLTLAEVRKLDAGSWKDARYKGEPVPTLEEALVNRDGLYVNIELKATPETYAPLAKEVVRLIEKHRLEKAVIISSFSADALKEVKRLNPKVRTGYLYGAKVPEVHPEPLDAVHPHFGAVTPEYMAWARDKGYQVNVWTVDGPDEMRRLIDLGVDSIITNVPNVLHEVRAEVKK